MWRPCIVCLTHSSLSVVSLINHLAFYNNSVTAFYNISQQSPPSSTTSASVSPDRQKQEREFQIGSIGLADSFGILLASIIAVPTEVMLCEAQVGRGRDLCKRV